MSQPALQLDGVTKDFGGGAGVFNLDLTVSSGQILGLIGPSGSGKTTSVRLMTGVIKPDAGSVRLFGKDPTTLQPRDRRRLGYLPQTSSLYPRLSLRENLRFISSIYDTPRGRIDPVLDLVGLAEHGKRRLADASGGMQRRVGLAAALLADPEMLFLDEPTAGIDPVLRAEMWDHFRDLRDEGRTLLVTTQYVGEAAFCDRVAVIVRGRVTTVDTPEGLRRRAYGGTPIDLSFGAVPPHDLVIALGDIEGVSDVRAVSLSDYEILTDAEPGPVLADIAEVAGAAGVEIASLSERSLSFDEIFRLLVDDEQPAVVAS